MPVGVSSQTSGSAAATAGAGSDPFAWVDTADAGELNAALQAMAVEDPSELHAVAEDPGASPEMLKVLSNGTWSVRQRVAGNPSAGPQVLERLAHDDIRGVRAAVAGNPATPPEAQYRLAADPETVVVCELVDNPAAHPEALHRAGTTSDSYVVVAAVDRHPNTTPKTRRRIQRRLRRLGG